MKILIARLNHETNTYSPVATPLESFSPRYGAQGYRAAKGTRTAAGAFIDLAEAAGAEIVVPVIAGANPSGRVAADAYTHLTDTIVAAAAGCDAVMLDLHGAMVAENSDDGEENCSSACARSCPTRRSRLRSICTAISRSR
jgi:microcystin degradation protein MlrC